MLLSWSSRSLALLDSPAHGLSLHKDKAGTPEMLSSAARAVLAAGCTSQALIAAAQVWAYLAGRAVIGSRALWVQAQQHQQAVEAARAEAQAARQELEDLTQKHDELYSQIGSYKQHIDDLTDVMDSTEAARAVAAQETSELR